MKRYCTEDTIQDGRLAQQLMTYIIFHQRNANENHADHDTPIRMIRWNTGTMQNLQGRRKNRITHNVKNVKNVQRCKDCKMVQSL